LDPRHAKAHQFVQNGLFREVHTFTALESRIAALSTKQERGDAFEVFAEAYFATQPITQTQQVWPLSEVPTDIRSALGLVTRDMGVDGVIETTLGSHDAYQVKFRKGRAALSWKELSTFMGLSDKAGQRILFTNSNNLPPVINKRRGFFCIRGADLDRLEARDFEAIQHWLESSKTVIIHKTPKPHQEEALGALLSGLKLHDRATTVMACGSGKTLVELWLAERADYRTVLVFVPSLALIRQTLHEWLRETSWQNFTYLCVCSDPTVAMGTDELIVQQSDLDFPVTTESAVVKKFLERSFDGVRIVFSTYQSAEAVAKGCKGLAPFDLGIFDEAHKTAGSEDARFGYALRDKKLPIRKRLFLTATPRHYDVCNKDKDGDKKLIYSMDLPELYGPVVYALTFSEAARRDIICGYKVLISVVTSEMVNEYFLRHGEVLVKGDTVKAQQVANQIAIQKTVEKYDVKRILTFHSRIASAKSFVAPGGEGMGAHLPEFSTLHVNGQMRTADRDGLMREFSESMSALMTNARCLTEGVDLPAVDMVAFMSPRKSKVDIVQAVGRAMRKSGSKTKGYVLVPAYLEQAENESVEQAVKRADFEAVWDVLEAMQEQDDVLAEIIRQMRKDRGRTGGYSDLEFKDRIEVLGPATTLESLRESITTECVEHLGVFWDERYGQLLAYKEHFGNCDVPQVGEHPALGQWCRSQRRTFTKGELSPERISRLDEIGFVWSIFDRDWEEMFGELVAYKDRLGDIGELIDWQENAKLGKWCSRQRQFYKEGRLSAERIKRLEELRFVWDLDETIWEKSFQELNAYKKQYGYCNVIRSGEHAKLSKWSTVQRRAFNKGKLSPQRIARLEAIGLMWDPIENVWNQRFQELAAYKNHFGDCNVSLKWNKNPELGLWCSHQRQAFKRGELSPERITRLEELEFLWVRFEGAWEKMFGALIDYKKRFGNCNVPQGWNEDQKLGRWVSTQRRLRKKDQLSPERMSRLSELGFVWDRLDGAWERAWVQRYQELVAYKNRFGDCNVPKRWCENTTLGLWCGTQRAEYKKGKLTPERINRLEKIGFRWQLH
jgi:superfamily II DNA or RNA helicase